jgi:hypothetical protein
VDPVEVAVVGADVAGGRVVAVVAGIAVATRPGSGEA